MRKRKYFYTLFTILIAHFNHATTALLPASTSNWNLSSLQIESYQTICLPAPVAPAPRTCASTFSYIRSRPYFHTRQLWHSSMIFHPPDFPVGNSRCFVHIIPIRPKHDKPTSLSDILYGVQEAYQGCIGTRQGQVVRRRFPRGDGSGLTHLLVTVGPTWHFSGAQPALEPYPFHINPIGCVGAQSSKEPPMGPFMQMIEMLQSLPDYELQRQWPVHTRWETPFALHDFITRVELRSLKNNTDRFSLAQILERLSEIMTICGQTHHWTGFTRVGPSGMAMLTIMMSEGKVPVHATDGIGHGVTTTNANNILQHVHQLEPRSTVEDLGSDACKI